MSVNNSILQLKNISVGYNSKLLVGNINIQINKGELVSLMGLNGVGKTSFFKTILKENKQLSGDILINNKLHDQLKIEEYISVVYTDKIDVFGITVLDLISLGRSNSLNWLGKLKDSDKKLINKYIKLLDLEEIKNIEINKLSDGQFQKVMIAKSLAQETPIILLDEPTAFLDVKNKKIIHQLLYQLSKEENKTIIVSTHDISFCKDYCDSFLLIKDNKMELFESNKINEKLFI